MKVTDECVSELRVGLSIKVETNDGWKCTGRLIGLTADPDGPQLRVLGKDGIERRVDLPAVVKVG